MKAFHAVLLFAALAGVATCLFEKEHVLVSITLPWIEAKGYCRQNYADLSSINNRGELMKLKNLGTLNTEGWIGLRKKPKETFYTQWSDGAKLKFAEWGTSEVVDYEGTYCVILYQSAFYNVNCSIPLMFFCYTWVPKMIVVPAMMNWEESLNYCRNNYNDLISISTEDDVLAVNKTLINQTSSLWTGLRFMDGLWFWVNQEENVDLSSLPLCPAKPFHCGDVTTGVALNVKDCNEKMSFICY
ncbi:Macrophage mannose receptor 1 [Bagarius yarrelli]|uniref:Macrophage mannose receptor 1 n=1 Tax=Bagarius yarrelli TaxID=175774 RepID=A0A556TWE2_BAGYA|nr:Macrophage mannose receptor 1 [Bagarius yarrelli]